MKLIFLISFFTIFLSSCSLRKKVVYFGDFDKIQSENSFSVKLKKDDYLLINVYGVDEVSSKLFNSSLNSTVVNKGYQNGTPSTLGYLINQNGEIQFPIIGVIKLEGLTKFEAIELLKNKLKKYLNDPVVDIQIQNFKITVLGEVRNPGTFNIPNDKISILEAIGLAGDITINGLRKNIKLIREEENIKKQYVIDITNTNFISTKLFYLNQNDIIYVEPNRSKINSSLVSSTAGVFISVASLIITTANIILK